MVEAVETMDGWYCLHDLRTIDWTSWKMASSKERQIAITQFQSLLTGWENVEDQKNGSHAMYQVIGQKADLMFMFLRPSLEELVDLETRLNQSTLAEFLIPAYSYFSIVDRKSVV